ncbi:MAG: DUF5688 family protein [bacterium]|nr:DUF5688 family protein [bacterium]MCM1424255.1 DUF5688 family protein [bacterium]
MNFETFVENIAETLQERMGDAYEIRVIRVTKNNGVELTGVAITTQENSVFPTIYLDSLYEEYKLGDSIEDLADQIINCHEEQSMALDLDMDFFHDYDSVKDRIFYKLVSFSENRKFLQDAPHLRWHDLAIVFYYALEDAVLEGASITIRRQHMMMWKQSAESLYRVAKRNTRRDMPEFLVSIRELVEDVMGITVQEEDDLPLYVLTNREKRFGAAAMLYSEQMEELAETFSCDLLILPSSVHEVLLLPDDHCQEYDFYRQMVSEVNRTQVEAEEVLSYGLYRYRRATAEIEEIIS